MASTPEKHVKNAVTKVLKQYGAYYFSPVTGGYGKSGVPDIIACVNGQFVGIECKAGNNKPTALQLRELEAIRNAGGYAIVINEANQNELIQLLETITR